MISSELLNLIYLLINLSFLTNSIIKMQGLFDCCFHSNNLNIALQNWLVFLFDYLLHLFKYLYYLFLLHVILDFSYLSFNIFQINYFLYYPFKFKKCFTISFLLHLYPFLKDSLFIMDYLQSLKYFSKLSLFSNHS